MGQFHGTRVSFCLVFMIPQYVISISSPASCLLLRMSRKLCCLAQYLPPGKEIVDTGLEMLCEKSRANLGSQKCASYEKKMHPSINHLEPRGGMSRRAVETSRAQCEGSSPRRNTPLEQYWLNIPYDGSCLIEKLLQPCIFTLQS